MKTNQSISVLKPILLIVVTFFISSVIFAQEDILQDSTLQDTTIQEEPKKEKKESKRKDSFKIFGGGTINALNVSSDMYESSEDAGFMLGVSYKRGKFFYYEFGARYNQYGYKLTRIVGVRIFAGLVPAFRLSVGDNELGITKESTNTFNLHGQAGVGVDVAFLFIEAGFNYGFGDLLKNDVQSNPVQVFINLGFRF
jgi:hypothetical protein